MISVRFVYVEWVFAQQVPPALAIFVATEMKYKLSDIVIPIAILDVLTWVAGAWCVLRHERLKSNLEPLGRQPACGTSSAVCCLGCCIWWILCFPIDKNDVGQVVGDAVQVLQEENSAASIRRSKSIFAGRTGTKNEIGVTVQDGKKTVVAEGGWMIQETYPGSGKFTTLEAVQTF
mmetsp:Transcript_26541/g.47977  ORF Transcript_26541/g.47977 Transcript_26541/m.47977 type:complete len:176 (-) Transcript_26541:170-697(-)